MAEKAPKRKAAQRKRRLSVVKAVEDDLARLGKRDAKLAKSAHAATALALARDLDDTENSATSHSLCARALNETMTLLFELAPEERRGGKIDELKSRRAARRAAA